MMTWQFTPFLLLVVIAAVSTGLLTLVVWRQRSAHAAGALVMLTALACLWSTAYAFEVAATTLATKLFWIRIQYLAIATLPVAWLLFALRFARRDAYVTRRNVLLLLSVPVVTILLVWTEPAHALYYRALDLRTIEGLTYFAPQYGPWFWVHSLYSYACYVAGVVFIYRRLRETTGALQRQAEIVLIGSLPPFITSFVFVFAPTTLDPAPIAFALSSLFFAWALLRLRLLDDTAAADASGGDDVLAAALAVPRERMLNFVLRALAVAGGVLGITAVVIAFQQAPLNLPLLIGGLLVYGLLLVFAFFPRIPFALRGGFLLFILYLMAFVNIGTAGLDVNAGILLFAFVALAFGLYGRAVGLLAMVVGLLTLGLSGWQIVTGELSVTPVLVAGANPWLVLVPLFAFGLFVGALLLSQASLLTRLRALLDQSQALSQQLAEERALLEQRVAERTRALAISATLSRELSTILEPDQLVEQVVNRLQEAFDYYHTHIYLLDDASQTLRMVGGTGEPGREMARRGHGIQMGVGLVGRAAATGAVVLARDTAQEPNWQPNPLLPDTRSEIAVPIQFANEVLGVLDVQQRAADGFGAQDIDLLQSVANQLAVVLRNSRLYADARQRAEREALANQISQRILQTTDVEEALKVAVLELGEALHAPQTEVRLAPGENSAIENRSTAQEARSHGS